MSVHAAGLRPPAVLAGRIEDEIARQGWEVGSVLGSESELLARYGVSRALFREAARLLEQREVAVMRRGPHGGLVVRAPDVAAVTSAVVVYLEYVGTTLQHVLEARSLLEPPLADLAARKIDEGGIEELRAMLTAEHARAEADGSALNTDLVHVCLGELSGNRPLAILINTLVRLTYRYAERSAQTDGEKRRVLGEVTRAHDALADAVVAGDAGLAHHRMTLHVAAISSFLIAKNPDLRRTGATPGDSHLPTSKLAPRVADAIIGDILALGWPVGAVIASEAELIERHAVGRAALREALRILEHYSVARMRRGHRGGLVVLQPDRSAALAAMSAFVASRQVGWIELHRARALIEVSAFDMLLRKQSGARLPGRPGALEHLLEMDSDLHRTLWRADGNPVLQLFAEVIASLATRPGARQRARAACTAATHEPIYAALRAGDLSLARHRLQRHLLAMGS